MKLATVKSLQLFLADRDLDNSVVTLISNANGQCMMISVTVFTFAVQIILPTSGDTPWKIHSLCVLLVYDHHLPCQAGWHAIFVHGVYIELTVRGRGGDIHCNGKLGSHYALLKR